MVVIATIYNVILPAITMEKQCDMEEHTHTDSCYRQASIITQKQGICTLDSLNLHQHTEDCFDEQGKIKCGYADFIIHEHNEGCYDEQGNLWCPIPEKTLEEMNAENEDEPVTIHSHDESCFDENNNLICDKMQLEQHEHNENCFEEVEIGVDEKELICTKEEHIHTEQCNLNDNSENDMATTLSTSLDNRLDFTSCIKNVTYENPHYNPETDQVEVSFDLKFKITKDMIYPESGQENLSYIYSLPEEIVIPDTMLNKTYTGRDANGVEGFTYFFVKNEDGTYSVGIDFIQSYVQGKDNFEGFISYSAHVNHKEDEDTEYEFKFTDSVTVTIKAEEIQHPDNESMHYDIKVDKSNSSYNYKENKITYKIVVDSKKGTPDPINLKDILNTNGLDVESVKLVNVVKEDRVDDWNLDWQSKTEIKDCSLNYNQDNKEITMALPGLEPGIHDKGQRYTITYDVYFKEPATGNSYEVSNKVSVTGTEKGETIIDSDETKTTVTKDLDLMKSGSYDKEKNEIIWTIKVNQHKNNLANSILSDDMFASINKEKVSISPSEGITWNGNQLKFTGINGTDVNTNSYTITYKTNVPDNLEYVNGVATVDNTATVTPPSGNEETSDAEVTIDKKIDIQKDGSYDKSKDKIQWSITINENKSDLNNAVLTDTMFNQIKTSDIKIEPSTGFTVITDENGNIKRIVFNEDAQNNTYVITYETDVPETQESVTVTNSSTITPANPNLPPKTDEETVVVDKTVDVNKVGKYDKKSDLITWTITINQNKNDITGKFLSDEMFSQIDKSNIKIEPNTGYVWTGDNLTFTSIDGKPNEQTYTIIYKTPSNINVNESGVVSNKYGLDNKKSEATVSVDRSLHFNKSGSYDSSNQCIEWTIDLSKQNQNIFNYVLTDTMFDKIMDGSLKVMMDGNTVNEETGMYQICKENNQITQILFKGENSINTHHYTIKYKTPVTSQWNETTVKNHAEIDPPGDVPNIPTDSEVKVPAQGSVVKKVESGKLAEDNKLEIQWLMEVKVPKGGLPSGTVITDTLKDGQWMTMTQIQEWGSMINANDEDGKPIQGTNYWWPPGKTYNISFFSDDGLTYTYDDIVHNNNDAYTKHFVSYKIEFIQ
ncbi:collagen binding domain-containing protein [Floccifex sp.]|uniref:collagen binding domain-containing protein n=1 Tax=Floccifex sp. TaxID=2815810 RepID=UPI003EFEDC56